MIRFSKVSFLPLLSFTALCAFITPAPVFSAQLTHSAVESNQKSETPSPAESVMNSAIDLHGQKIAYKAVSGTLLIHASAYDDSETILKERGAWPETANASEEADSAKAKEAGKPEKEKPAVASMFYTAYFRENVAHPEKRPIIFFYNGGPGSSSVWLHVGSFGPKRVQTSTDGITPPPPYKLADNPYSLLDKADLVFIDAPATGFSRIGGKDSVKTFMGVDGDAKAFAQFINDFLRKYGRTNSPRYLFGESYGTLRSAVVANLLQNTHNLDLNGVILLSQILNYDNNGDTPQLNPGMDLPYALELPSYAATAFKHKRLTPMPEKLEPFLREVEKFAMGDYLHALEKGADLSEAERHAIAQKLQSYTGIDASYWEKADLRVNCPMFAHELLGKDGEITGRLDSGYHGAALDPMGKEAMYDPMDSAFASAYISSFYEYLHHDLKYGDHTAYHIFAPQAEKWDFHHADPMGSSENSEDPSPNAANVMPDLAIALKRNPNLHVMLNGGYFDLGTPYYQGMYEMKHLPVPKEAQKRIEFHYYPTGHMVYVHEEVMKNFHDNVEKFIEKTASQDAHKPAMKN